MATPKQLTANRSNSAKSTGPTTLRGKRTVARNALRHGLLSTLRVLPFVEQEQDWENHYCRLHLELAPVGYLEETLVQRVALLTWRLARIARYENTSAAAGVDQAEVELDMVHALKNRPDLDLAVWEMGPSAPPPPSILAQTAATVANERALCNNIERLLNNSDTEDSPIPGADAAWMLDELSEAIGVRYWNTPDGKAEITLPGVNPGQGPERRQWTASQLRQCLHALCDYKKLSIDRVMQYLAQRARKRMEFALSQAEQLRTDLSRRRELHVLPNADARERVIRYEAHTERSLYRALHELERRQAQRHGAPVIPPVAVDVTVTDSDNLGSNHGTEG